MGDALGDRVTRWTTINEPWCIAMLGYGSGVHAPGRANPAAAIAAGHHVLLAHGLAVDALRASTRDPIEIAIALNPYPVVPASDRDLDHDAARRVDGVQNRWWYDAILRGRYPDDVLDDFASVSDLSVVRDGDLAQIARSVDALGINYYRRHHVRHGRNASAMPGTSAWPGSPDVELLAPDAPTTDGGWPIEPDGLGEVLRRAAREYGPIPVYVHENGAVFDDEPDASGQVDDRRRIDYLAAHFRSARDALAAGIDLRGFFVWSFLDNFEWAEGYAHRFGIVHVDFDTLRRTPKASARWYSQIARERALDHIGSEA
jgi:beta-glucosidase